MGDSDSSVFENAFPADIVFSQAALDELAELRRTAEEAVGRFATAAGILKGQLEVMISPDGEFPDDPVVDAALSADVESNGAVDKIRQDLNRTFGI